MRCLLLQRNINIPSGTTSTDVENLSTVVGTTVTAALDTLKTAVDAATADSSIVWVTGVIPDVEVTNPVFVPAPVTGTLTAIHVCIAANPGSTCTITTSIGGVAVTGGAVAVGAAEGNGVVKSATPTANNAVTVGTSSVRIESDAGGGVATPATILLGFTRA